MIWEIGVGVVFGVVLLDGDWPLLLLFDVIITVSELNVFSKLDTLFPFVCVFDSSSCNSILSDL